MARERTTVKDIAKHAGRLKFEWSRKGVTLSTPDTTIAAVALAHQLILITDNRKHYPMPDLRPFEESPRR